MKKCRICKNRLRKTTQTNEHVHEPSPVAPHDICVGCWMAGVELEKFLYRATKHTPMGDWTPGWLRAIIAEPKKYLI